MGVLKSKPEKVQVGRSGAAESTIPKGSAVTRSLNVPEAKAIQVQASNAMVENKPKISSSQNLSETKPLKVKELHRTVEANIERTIATIAEHTSHLQLSDDISSRLDVDMSAKRNEETVNQSMCENVIQHDIKLVSSLSTQETGQKS